MTLPVETHVKAESGWQSCLAVLSLAWSETEAAHAHVDSTEFEVSLGPGPMSVLYALIDAAVADFETDKQNWLQLKAGKTEVWQVSTQVDLCWVLATLINIPDSGPSWRIGRVNSVRYRSRKLAFQCLGTAWESANFEQLETQD